MKYIETKQYAGLGRIERTRLAQLLRNFKGSINVELAAKTWGITATQAAKILSWFNKKGWLRRIARGVYIPVSLSAESSDVVLDEPFVIAENFFTPCYIGGVNAVNYWDLTEQIFSSITVFTTKLLSIVNRDIAGTKYVIHKINSKNYFGLKSVWISGVKVKISDPSRTIIDLLLYPNLCGGLRFMNDIIINYFNSEYKNIDMLIGYLKIINIGALLKRLGFLLELNFPNEEMLIDFCKNNLTTGYAKLTLSQDCPRLIRRWRLWVPNNWKDKIDVK